MIQLLNGIVYNVTKAFYFRYVQIFLFIKES